MKIRSITCFIDPSFPLDPGRLSQAGEFVKYARPAFEETGYEVQTTRLATVPFSRLVPKLAAEVLGDFSVQLEGAAADQGYEYVSLGPALIDHPSSYGYIPEAMARTTRAFFSGSMTGTNGKISLDAVHRCAEVIRAASLVNGDGFANLRFAALANVPHGSPFFPAAYHEGDTPAFAVATEAADLALKAFEEASSLAEARRILVLALEKHGQAISEIAKQIEKQSRIKFGGIDFSLAPYPTSGVSLGTALEKLGVSSLGSFGSLSAAAFLADTIDRAKFSRVGFSGLLLPVLEDATLAKAAAAGSLEIKDLLLYSAVCGTGLDCIPLPGDSSIEQLYAVLLDLASLSSRLAKPLTARLMPIPGKQAGDPTGFNFDYFANSRVMSLPAEPLSGLLDGMETFDLQTRRLR